MSTLQQRIESRINARIEAAIDAAIDRILGDGNDGTGSLKSNLHEASKANGKASNTAVQDLMDVARRAVRLARTGKSALSKQERKVARSVMKRVKSEFTITSGDNDVWKSHGC